MMDITRRVADNLAANYREVRKVVDDVMGGEVWELDVDKAINEAVEEKDKVIQEQNEALVAKDRALAAKDTALAEKDRQAAVAMITALRKRGVDDGSTLSDLQTILGLSRSAAKAALAACSG